MTKNYGKRKFSIDKLLSVLNIIALCLIGFIMIYPFWEILVKSFMTDKEIISSKTFFFCKNFHCLKCK